MDSSAQSWTPEEVCEEVTGILQSLKFLLTLIKTKRDWDTKVAHLAQLSLCYLDIEELWKEANIYRKKVDHLEKGIYAAAFWLECIGY